MAALVLNRALQLKSRDDSHWQKALQGVGKIWNHRESENRTNGKILVTRSITELQTIHVPGANELLDQADQLKIMHTVQFSTLHLFPLVA